MNELNFQAGRNEAAQFNAKLTSDINDFYDALIVKSGVNPVAASEMITIILNEQKLRVMREAVKRVASFTSPDVTFRTRSKTFK
jgi:hypothetical protein